MTTGLHTSANRVLASALAEARVAAGLTQYDLAQRLSVDQTYVSKYENSRRRLDLVEFLTIMRAIGADPVPIIQRLASVLEQP